MKLKRVIASLGVVSMIGIGLSGVVAHASEEGSPSSNNPSKVSDNTYYERNCGLTDEQERLVDKGYNELTKDEKAIFDKYYRQPKADLSDDELSKYFEIQDKAYKYLGEDFVGQGNRYNHMNWQGRGEGQGRYRGMCN